MHFTKKQLAECAWRELQKRRENYPRWVRESKMRQSVADEQIAMMQSIYRVMIQLSEKELQEAQRA